MEFYFKRRYGGTIKGVILDWAGTTVDFGCIAPAISFKKVFAEKGIEISTEEARAPMGLHKRDHIREIAKMPRVSRLWNEVYNKNWTEDDIEAMFNDFIPKQLNIIGDYAELVPEALEAQRYLRESGIKIGSTTGYNTEMMKIVTEKAKEQGYVVDDLVCASEVPTGRPAPWMAYRVAMNLDIYPMEAMLKIGDTISDIEEGLNSGMWTAGVIVSSNEMGLSKEEYSNMENDEIEERINNVREKMLKAGAHYVIETLDELPDLVEAVNEKLFFNEKP